MGLFAGLRTSELIALQRSGMDYDQQHLSVAGQRSGQPRVFPLPTPLSSLFWICQHTSPPSSFLFVDGLGQPITPAALHHAFRATCQKACLADLCLQDLRHTFAAWAMQSQLPVGLIAVMMGARRLTSPWFAKYLVGLEQWGDLTATPPANRFDELRRLIVKHPSAYPLRLVSLFISPCHTPDKDIAA